MIQEMKTAGISLEQNGKVSLNWESLLTSPELLEYSAIELMQVPLIRVLQIIIESMSITHSLTM